MTVEAQVNVESFVARRELSGFLGAYHFGDECREAVDNEVVGRLLIRWQPDDFFGLILDTLRARDTFVDASLVATRSRPWLRSWTMMAHTRSRISW